MTNLGPANAQDIVLNATLSGSLTASFGWTLSPPIPNSTNGFINIGFLAPGQTYFVFDNVIPNLQFNLIPPSTVTATVTSSTGACGPSNTTATASAP